MTKFMINNRTDAWKTDVNLLNGGQSGETKTKTQKSKKAVQKESEKVRCNTRRKNRGVSYLQILQHLLTALFTFIKDWSEGFPNMVLSTEYSEAVNARYTFQPLWVSGGMEWEDSPTIHVTRMGSIPGLGLICGLLNLYSCLREVFFFIF